MKKLMMLTVVILGILSFSSVAGSKFIAIQAYESDIGVVIVDGKFYYSDGGKPRQCSAPTQHSDTTDSGRPYYAVGAECGKQVVLVQQFKDSEGGSHLIIIDNKTQKRKVYRAVIAKGETI